MLRPTLRCAVRYSLALVFLPGLVRAQDPLVTYADYSNYCTTGSFQACASVEVEAISSPTGESAITMYFQNLQGTNPYDNTGGSSLNIMTVGGPLAIGTVTEGSDVGTEGSVGSLGSDPAFWDDNVNVSFVEGSVVMVAIPGADGVFGCDTLPVGPMATGANPPPWTGAFETCPAAGFGGSVSTTFSFESSGVPFTAQELSVGWLMEGVGGPSGPSAGCGLGPSAPQGNGCMQVTPEPDTIVLLFTGLAALAGGGVIRRRRSAQRT